MNEAIETGIDGVRLVALRRHADARGWLAEGWRADEETHRPAMAYVSVTKPGRARGPHEHAAQTDCFVFAGPGDLRLYLYDSRAGSATQGARYEETFGAARPAAAIIPPGVIHAYRCVSEHEAQVINLPDKLYAGEGKREPVDETRHEDNPDSPFFAAFDRALFINASEHA